MGLWSTLVNGAVNLSLDYLFIVVFEWGVFGVALATALGEIAVCLMGFVFYSNKKYAMHFTKPSKIGAYFAALLQKRHGRAV